MSLVLAASNDRAGKTDTSHDYWLKRQAIQITAQLPENIEDSLRVLDYAKELIEGFFRESD